MFNLFRHRTANDLKKVSQILDIIELMTKFKVSLVPDLLSERDDDLCTMVMRGFANGNYRAVCRLFDKALEVLSFDTTFSCFIFWSYMYVYRFSL